MFGISSVLIILNYIMIINKREIGRSSGCEVVILKKCFLNSCVSENCPCLHAQVAQFGRLRIMPKCYRLTH